MNLVKYKLLVVSMLALLFVPVLIPIPTYAAEGSLGTVGQEPKKNDCKQKDYKQLSQGNCGIMKIIVVITNFMAGISGVIIVAALVWGGIMYSMAGNDPSKVQAAKKRIYSALTALLLLVFGYAIIQWLVPGGLF